MDKPTYIGIEGARLALAEIGIELSYRQIKRAADPDVHGKRKLPFFVDPIDHRLKIDKNKLLAIYNRCAAHAEDTAKISPDGLKKALEPRA
jgi:hypothetical protein